MLVGLRKLIVFVAVVQMLGGHWLALQTVAWAGMVASYARGETLATALEKTFDGQHPCDLCQIVKTGRQQEQKQDVAKMIVKIEAVLPLTVSLPPPRSEAHQFPSFVSVAFGRSLAPPTPPPLAA